MSAPTIFTIHSSRHGEIVETHRISPLVAVAKARRLHGMARLHHGQTETAVQAARFGQASRTLVALIDGVAGSAVVPLVVYNRSCRRRPSPEVESRCGAVALGSNISVFRLFRLAVP
jgi:hypothetical protein